MNGTLPGREANRAAPQSDTYMAKMLRKPMKVAMSAAPLSVSNVTPIRANGGPRNAGDLLALQEEEAPARCYRGS